MSDKYAEFYELVVLDTSGSRIGGVSQVYLDDATGEPTFVAARSGLFGNKEVLVPLVGAFISDGLMQVPHDSDLVKQAPAPRPDRRMPPEFEAEVFDHYGLAYKLDEPTAATAASAASEPLAPAESAPAASTAGPVASPATPPDEPHIRTDEAQPSA